MKFKELLKELDVNGAQLSRKLGISVSAVASWCNGKSSPKTSRIRDIANALNVSVERVSMCFV